MNIHGEKRSTSGGPKGGRRGRTGWPQAEWEGGRDSTQIIPPNYYLLISASSTSQKKLWPDCANTLGVSITEGAGGGERGRGVQSPATNLPVSLAKSLLV